MEKSHFRMLEALGRTRLSDHFFMRDFLYSEISNAYGITNIPEHPDVAIEAGTQLCENLLEPLYRKFGHIYVRSAYRSPSINGKGAENRNQHNCSSNKASFADHIWDVRDKDGRLGATACIQVTWFSDRYDAGANWESLAWWIHDNLPYNSAFFFNHRAAFNLNWRERPEKWIRSYIGSGGKYLTKPGMPNWGGDHSASYRWIETELIRKKKAVSRLPNTQNGVDLPNVGLETAG